MKIKPLFTYLIVLIIFIASMIFFTQRTKEYDPSNPLVKKELPDDDVHGKLKKTDDENETPSKANVLKEAMDRLNSLKREVDKNPNDTLKIREYADMLTWAHQAEKAAENYNKILKVDPKRIDVLLQMTFVYFNIGDYNKAEEYSNKILYFDKNNLAANYNLGAIAVSKGDSKKAKAIWQSLVNRYPNTDIGRIAAQSIQQIERLEQK